LTREEPVARLSRYCATARRAFGERAELVVEQYAAPSAEDTFSESGMDATVFLREFTGDADTPAAVHIATTHPESVACIVTAEQPVDVIVEAEARFRLLVIAGGADTIRLTTPYDFDEGASRIELLGAADDVDEPAGVTLHSAATWSDAGLQSYADFAPLLTSWIGPVHWESGAVTLVEVDGPGPGTGLADWGDSHEE
jgi:hypothetical protein